MKWSELVAMSRPHLSKGNTLGREVYEFEIDIAKLARRRYRSSIGKPIGYLRSEFGNEPPTTIDREITWRTLTEDIHHTIDEEPCDLDSAWINVWHSVVETAYLAQVDLRKALSPLWLYEIPSIVSAGAACYLAYCQECRDWCPNPTPYHMLFDGVQSALWENIAHTYGKMMKDGFEDMGIYYE